MIFIGLTVFLLVIFIQSLDLLIEHVKNSPFLGIPYFLIQLIRHIVTQYGLVLIGLVVLLFCLSARFIKSRLLAIFYFVVPFPFLSIILGEEEFLPTLLIAGTFFVFGVGIWKNKTWVHIAALVFNAILLVGAAFLFSRIANTPCEGLGCIGIGIVWILSLYIVGFTLLTSPFLWYNIRTKDNAGVNKKIIWEAIVVEIIILSIVGVMFAPSYLDQSSKVAQHRSIHQPRWNRERLERERAIEAAVKDRLILYPSYLPMGWEKVSESLDKIQFEKYGVDRQVLQVKQSSRSSLEAKSREDLWSDVSRWKEQAEVLVNGRPARYATWRTAACTISNEIRELWWYDDEIFRSLYCSCPCTLSKSELARIAESMKSAK